MAKKASILLNLLNLSPNKIQAIMGSFNDIDSILNAKYSDLRQVLLLTDRDIKEILDLRNSGVLDKELKLIEKEKIDCLDLFDQDYPPLLKEISSPPLVLYINGNRNILNKFLLAIVGTRIPTIYGLSTAEDLAYRLSLLGIVIVSGLARGIDTAAHRGAIKKGVSIAVLGSGLLNVYPKDNKTLSCNIAKSGAVISEFPLFMPPLKENFPRRNRIVSGLSKGVLIVEAALRSGALITARLSCEQNRDVFAIPGNIDSPLSRGTHKLIKEGAILVDSLEDILKEFNIDFEFPGETPDFKLNSYEEKIFQAIDTRQGVFLEEILVKSDLGVALLNKTILDLQLKGIIKEVRPSCFVRT
ncbi:MAG: DNA-processing protein DprA [Omnitrophica bacterium]|nr:DNA-processing protein DprA [Candidatus Omnitrophota bacterium]